MTLPTHHVVYVATDSLKPYTGNARVHSKKQIKQIARSIQRYGFNAPVLVSDEGEIVAGHGRVEAAKLLDLEQVPVIHLSHLTAIERREYLLADNKLALGSTWDQDLLAGELLSLTEKGFFIEDTGFSMAEVDILLENVGEPDEGEGKRKSAREDRVPEMGKVAVTRRGDVWELGRHRLVCGDARDPAAYDALLGTEQVDLMFTDPPYNVAIERNVSGKGEVRHGDFAMASGEMSEEEFATFLEESLGAAAARCRDGAIAYVCMDWRHMAELLAAGRAVFSALKNLCVWNKTQASNGTFYRSKHELVFVFKKGTAAHINNFGLGGEGRYRTNVWDYAGANGFSNQSRNDELAMHPTVKPVAMVRDAILDCSNRGDLVLDCFAGSGTIMVAAHKTGRTARMIEYDPFYCDVIIRRFEKLTGKDAILSGTHDTFEDISELRAAEADLEETA
jgi:DNA modification methylase